MSAKTKLKLVEALSPRQCTRKLRDADGPPSEELVDRVGQLMVRPGGNVLLHLGEPNGYETREDGTLVIYCEFTVDGRQVLPGGDVVEVHIPPHGVKRLMMAAMDALAGESGAR